MSFADEEHDDTQRFANAIANKKEVEYTKTIKNTDNDKQTSCDTSLEHSKLPNEHNNTQSKRKRRKNKTTNKNSGWQRQRTEQGVVN